MRMSYTCTKSMIEILKVKHLDVRHSFMLNTVTLVLIEPKKSPQTTKPKDLIEKRKKFL